MTELAKAQLIELDPDFKNEKSGGQKVSVQFNPETLKVTFANQLVQPPGRRPGRRATPDAQFVGAGTTKLALTLWFDVTAMTQDAVDDVRRLTQKVIFFMTPTPDKADQKKMVPPATRFVWGSFLFDGSSRASRRRLNSSSPTALLRAGVDDAGPAEDPGRRVQRRWQGAVLARPDADVAGKGRRHAQGMAAKNGRSDWKGIAAANGIEDPASAWRRASSLTSTPLRAPASPFRQHHRPAHHRAAELAAGASLNIK